MFLAYLTLITALAISAVAIYYSVAGLAAIFAAAVVPIIIMGGILEGAKLVTAVWLHKYWHQCVWWLKTYLSIAVIVLMLITSMGIFGFLSKAHIEQTSLSVEQLAQAEQLTEQIDRLENRVSRWNEELDRLFSGGDVRVDSLLSREQQELDAIYARMDREKNQLRQDAQGAIDIQNNRLSQAQARRDQNIANAQLRFESGSSELSDAIDQATSAEVSVASAVQREIIAINRNLNQQLDAVDEKYQSQVTDVQSRISQLRSQSTDQTDSIDQRVAQLEQLVREEQTIINGLRQEKASAERAFRMLEAEVGPIKYIAEFVYGKKADKDILEEAVRWVIIIIIFVFDPLAVLLLIASQFTFQYIRQDRIDSGQQVEKSKIDSFFDSVAPKEYEIPEERIFVGEQEIDNPEEDLSPEFVTTQPMGVETPEHFVSRILKTHVNSDNWYYDHKKASLSSNEGVIAYNISEEDAINITRLAASIMEDKKYTTKHLGKVGAHSIVMRKPVNE